MKKVKSNKKYSSRIATIDAKNYVEAYTPDFMLNNVLGNNVR